MRSPICERQKFVADVLETTYSPPVGGVNWHDRRGRLDVAARRRRGDAARAGPADVRDERHVAVGGERGERQLAPVLVEQVAEVEDVELQGDTLGAHRGELLAEREVHEVRERVAAGVAIHDLAALRR